MSPSSSGHQSRKSPETGEEREKSLFFPGISYSGAEPSLLVLAVDHHILLVQPPSGRKLSVSDHRGTGRRCGDIWKCLWGRSGSGVCRSHAAGLCMEKEKFPCTFGNGDRPDHKSPQAALLSAIFRYMGPLSGADAAVCQFCVLHECQRGVLCRGGGRAPAKLQYFNGIDRQQCGGNSTCKSGGRRTV